MSTDRRLGFTVPLSAPLVAQRETWTRLTDAGFVDAWSAEVNGVDAFTPLALASAWEPRLRLGTAVVPVYTRSPPLIAQSAAALSEAAAGRFLLGIGASSKVVVEKWSGIPYVQPFQRTRDVLRFLKEALSGARVDRTYDSFAIGGFQLRRTPEVIPPILVAALGPGMVRLAAAEADGVILNFVSPSDVERVADLVATQASERREIVARIFVCPSEDPTVMRAVAARHLLTYLNVPAYASAQRWHGRGEALAHMWEAWDRGDRRSALDLLPDSVIDDLVIHGEPVDCRRRIESYFDGGLTAMSISVLGQPSLEEAARVLLNLAKVGPRLTRLESSE